MDSGINPDMGNDSSSNEVCVPLESVTIDGQAPQEGDTVDFAIEARVSRVDNDMAYVVPTKVNGQDVDQEENESPSDESSEPSFSSSGDYMG